MLNVIFMTIVSLLALLGAGVFSYTYFENKVGPQLSAPILEQAVPKAVSKIIPTVKVATSTTVRTPVKVPVAVAPKASSSLATVTTAEKKVITPDEGPLRVVAVVTTTTTTTTTAPTGTLSIRGVIEHTNIARAQNGGLPALTENFTLNLNAEMKLQDMFTKQYFEHVSPSGVGPGDLAKTVGYAYVIVGENLALGDFGSDAKLVDAWMNSPGHRANILNTHYQEIGVAVGKGMYEGRNTWLAVQSFGLPLSACPAIDAQMKAQIDANNAQISDMKIILDAKKAQLDSTSKNDPNYNIYVGEFNALLPPYNTLIESTRTLVTTYNAQVQAYNACIATAGV